MNTNIRIQERKEREWVLLHDFYHESPEPDAPGNKFENLSKEEKELAASHYASPNFKAVIDAETLIGFVGFFPDDNDNINLFYVISPEHRGKGYLSKILQLSLEYCRREFVGFKYIRGLTRQENISSIKGLERFSFVRNGTVIEEIQPGIVYEEYLFPI